MEVHHHAHTSRKKWTHYFWEFLMLFLAVFCGFLAEYQLEHVIEHNKEKEYMQSMVEDLEQDTTEINRVVTTLSEYNNNSDTVLTILESAPAKDHANIKHLYLLHYNLGAEVAGLSQRTMSQLKNAGGLRLIRKKGVADTISLYDNKSQYLVAVFKSYDEISTAAFHSGVGIFDNQYIRHRFKNGKAELLTDDPITLRRYANIIFTYQGIGKYYKQALLFHKELAIGLIALIKKEYHLK